MSKVAAYREAMLARKAAKAGCTVAELLERGERELQATYRCAEIRFQRRSAWPTIAQRATSRGGCFAILTAAPLPDS